MKVVQVIDSLNPSGGAEQALLATAPRLVDLGIDLRVIKLAGEAGASGDLEAMGISVLTASGGSRWARARAVRAHLRRNSPDLVHTTLFEADLAGRAAGASLRIPVLTSLVNDPYGAEHRRSPHLSPTKVRLAQVADAGTARLARHFHALSNHVADTMSRRLRIDRSRMTVIPRGRSSEALGRRTPSRRGEVRAALGVGERPVVLAVGRGEHQKGLDILLAAVPTIGANLRDVTVLVAGRDGSSTRSLHRMTEERDLGAVVRFLGYRRDVPDLMAAADVLVFPSRWEGLGSTLIEAMALELPIVATRLPAIEEVLGGVGHLVGPEDDTALAAAVLAVFHHGESAIDKAQLGRARFESSFQLDAIAERTVSLYRRVVGRET